MNMEMLPQDTTTFDPAEAAYQQWRELNRKAADDSSDASLSEAEWAIVDKAEIAVLQCTNMTPRAAERKLWIALMHDMDDIETEPLILAEDIEGLQVASPKMDWPQRLQISAISSLRGASNA